MSVLQRQRVEALLALTAARLLIEAGYFLTINDGEEDVVINTRDLHEVAGALMKTDEDTIIAATDKSPPATHETTIEVGRVMLIYGNDGHDVIHDYSSRLHETLKPALALAETFEPGNRRTDVQTVLEQIYRHMVALSPMNIADQLNELVGELNAARMSVRAQPIGNLIGITEDKMRKLVERIRADNVVPL
jgi:hypothetical protein